MTQAQQSTEQKHQKPKPQRTPRSEGPAALQQAHPIRELQGKIGNAQIARMLGEEALWAPPEVGMEGGPVSNQLASRIYANLAGGHPLSHRQQASLEATFGRPMDDVRIHDDAEADALSQSVGASAFTLGSDVFFSHLASPTDQHLLAHEVAHVVQQESISTSGQLTVGSAADPLEREAEWAAGREADSGASSETPVAGGARVQRDVAEDLREFANIAEQEQREQMELAPPPVMRVNNIQDANSARGMMTEIEGYRANMQDGGRTGTVSGAQISGNEEAIAKLSDYLVTVGEQGRTLGTFQEQVQQLRLDFGRVSGQMMHLEAMGVVDPGETSTFRAEQIVGAATGASSAEESAAGVQGDAAVIRGQAQEAHNVLMTTGNTFSRAQRAASQAVHGLNSALSNLNAGIIPREQDPALAARQRAIKAKVSTMQSRLSTGLQVLSAIGGAAGLGTAATTAATSAFGGTLTGLGRQALGGVSANTLATAISEEWYREETNQIQAQIDQANAESREAAITANVSQVRAAQTALFSAMRTLEERLTEYQQARDTLRTTLNNLGAAADLPGGNRDYTVIAQLLGDVDVLTVQIDTTTGLGQTEEHAAGLAAEARGGVEGTRNEETGERAGGVTYYEPYQHFQLANIGRSGGLVYKASPQRINFITSQRTAGSAYGGEGAANPIVRLTMDELAEMRDTVQGMRDVLSRSLGLTMQR